MSIRYPGESAEYRTARDRLLEREIELRRATEAVAAERRALPAGHLPMLGHPSRLAAILNSLTENTPEAP
jgi:Bacterial protein of unknown function (DUF899)